MLGWTFYGNTVLTWLIAAGTAALVVGVLVLARRVLSLRLKRLADRTEAGLDDVIARTLDAMKGWFTLVAGLWAGSLLLALPVQARGMIDKAATLALIAQLGIWGATAIASAVDLYGSRKLREGDGGAETTIRAVGILARMALWVVVVLVVLDTVLAVDITALVAGLGIGGIAVALALQNVLGDLFASLSIVLDKPFVAGDSISVGDASGTVERVGLKTTRLRSASGEQLVISNSDLLASRIRNFRQMSERRVVFSLGVTYQTAVEKLRRIPVLVREVIEAHPGVRFERAHFNRYGASSLDFEVAFSVLDARHDRYMDAQQDIYLELFERFGAEGIDFAYPTQTLYLTRERPAEQAAEPGPAQSRG